MLDFCSAHSWKLFLVLVLIASLRIGATWGVLSHTSDEPAHLACGVEWWQNHKYTIEPQHPPLSRLAAAALPYLRGARLVGIKDFFYEGSVLLYEGGHYWDRLISARAGILPFFWLAALAVFLWARRAFGPSGAVVAALLFTTTPPILAHASQATTDMALTAAFALTFYVLFDFCEAPNWRRGALLGVCFAMVMLSKFSGLLYCACAAAALTAWWWFHARPGWHGAARRLGALLPGLGVAAGVAFMLVWAGYFFSWGKPSGFSFALPFPELFDGIKQVRDHAAMGHDSYFMGEVGRYGWWIFFPVMLAVKAPFATLLLAAVACWRRPRDPRAFALPLVIALTVLAPAMFSTINIGVRHILPIFVPLTILATAGLLALVQIPKATYATAALLAWAALTGISAHPDYLSYFNLLAGEHPEEIAVDSDLDWGQDTQRLGNRLRELGATSVAFSPPFHASLALHGFPPVQPNDPLLPAPGWNAVSLTFLKRGRLGLPLNEKNLKPWPERIAPTERVGRTIWLYYFPAGQQ